MCGKWVGDRTDCNILTPKFLCIAAALLPHSVRLFNRGPEDPSPLSGAGSHCLELQLELQLQLTSTNSTRLWHPVISLFDIHLLPVGVAIAPNSTRPQVKVIPRYLRPNAPVSWLTAGSRVNMLHQDMQSFIEFLVSIINHCQIKWLHLF